MTGFEYELNKQCQDTAMKKAAAIRQANAAQQPAVSLRKMIGLQLVKLGERLQSDAHSTDTAHPAAYTSF